MLGRTFMNILTSRMIKEEICDHDKMRCRMACYGVPTMSTAQWPAHVIQVGGGPWEVGEGEIPTWSNDGRRWEVRYSMVVLMVDGGRMEGMGGRYGR